MARKAKLSDSIYNARRREYRAAQRYLKKAEQTTGATAAQNRALARIHLENALETYDPTNRQNISSQIVNLGAQLGIDVYSPREEFSNLSQKEQKAAQRKYKSKVKDFEARSMESLESTLGDPEKRRQLEAQARISNKSIGKRVMGGLVEIWRDSVNIGASAEENRKAAEQAIFKHFGVTNWADALDKIEQNVGSELYSLASDLEVYDIVRIELQKSVKRNRR